MYVRFSRSIQNASKEDLEQAAGVLGIKNYRVEYSDHLGMPSWVLEIDIDLEISAELAEDPIEGEGVNARYERAPDSI
jgi:hypothetical protein